MVDVLIDGDSSAAGFRRSDGRYVVGVDQDTHYAFHLNSVTEFVYNKSIDGGLTWAAPVEIHTGFVVKFQVYYSRWTPDDTGTLIYIVLLHFGGLPDSLSFYTLDTADDSLSAEVEVQTVPAMTGDTYADNQVTIAKSRGGNLLVQFWSDAIGNHGCWRSVDGGASWAARTDGADGDDVDYVMLFPGNEADDQDFWMLYQDTSTDELSLKTYDDSGNSWSEAVFQAGIQESTLLWQYAGAIRDNDNHLLVAIWTVIDSPLADILTFDINGAASIVAMANVVTNLAESGNVCLTIDQQNDRIYVGYNKGGVYFATQDCVYRLSTDGMATWGAEQPMSEDAADDYRIVSSTASIGDAGGKFLPVWFNNDLVDVLCNFNNAVSIDPAPPPPPVDNPFPEYGQGRAAIGDPSVYGATIVRS